MQQFAGIGCVDTAHVHCRDVVSCDQRAVEHVGLVQQLAQDNAGELI